MFRIPSISKSLKSSGLQLHRIGIVFIISFPHLSFSLDSSIQFSTIKKPVPVVREIEPMILIADSVIGLGNQVCDSEENNQIGNLEVRLAANIDTANIRQGPGQTYSVIGSVRHGESLAAYAECNGWYKVSISGQDGWISNSVVKYTPTQVEELAPATDEALDTIIYDYTRNFEPLADLQDFVDEIEISWRNDEYPVEAINNDLINSEWDIIKNSPYIITTYVYWEGGAIQATKRLYGVEPTDISGIPWPDENGMVYSLVELNGILLLAVHIASFSELEDRYVYEKIVVSPLDNNLSRVLNHQSLPLTLDNYRNQVGVLLGDAFIRPIEIADLPNLIYPQIITLKINLEDMSPEKVRENRSPFMWKKELAGKVEASVSVIFTVHYSD